MRRVRGSFYPAAWQLNSSVGQHTHSGGMVSIRRAMAIAAATTNLLSCASAHPPGSSATVVQACVLTSAVRPAVTAPRRLDGPDLWAARAGDAVVGWVNGTVSTRALYDGCTLRHDGRPVPPPPASRVARVELRRGA